MIRTITRDDIPYLRTKYTEHPQFWQLLVSDYKYHCFIAKDNDNQYIGCLLATDKWLLEIDTEDHLIALSLLCSYLHSCTNDVQTKNLKLKDLISVVGFVKTNDVYKYSV